MKITTTLAVAFACATLAACGGGDDAADNMDANLMMTDNTMMPADNLTVSAENVTVVENGTNTMDLNTMDMNADLNATTNTP